MRRLVPTLVLAPVLLLLWAAPAPAATGDLGFRDCLAKFVASPCAAVPSEVLDGGRDVAVSPDGKLIFVADSEDSVVGFKRSLVDGSVSYASCVSSAAEPGCSPVAAKVLGVPRSLAFSPDSSSLYVVGETWDTLVRFIVGADGTLTLAGCAEDAALPESDCATEVPGLENVLRVVVAPDGAVYASGEEGAIAHFSASLALQGCYREVTVGTSCAQAEPLSAPYGLAVSPDGKHLYATSVGRDAIVWFTRGVGGALTFAGCIADDDDATAFSDNCAEEAGVNYDFVNHITFSPNGEHAYATDETGLGVVYHFTRSAPTGALTRQDCLANDIDADAPGCTELNDDTGSGLASVTDAVVSPDAGNLYTVARQDEALSTFGLSSPGGALSFIRCLRANSVVTQGCSPFSSATLGGPFGIAASSDGQDVYVANGSGIPALLHFEREDPGTRPGEEEGPGPDPDPDPDPGSGSGSNPGPGPAPPPPPPTPPQAKCANLKATIVGTSGADTLRGTAKRDVIAAGAGNDKVQGLGGKDVVCGEGGNDNLNGGADADHLLGGPGKDVLKGAAGKDRLVGGPGRDAVKQ
jgi:DNA-binding beta-propeller fold protein YncE